MVRAKLAPRKGGENDWTMYSRITRRSDAWPIVYSGPHRENAILKKKVYKSKKTTKKATHPFVNIDLPVNLPINALAKIFGLSDNPKFELMQVSQKWQNAVFYQSKSKWTKYIYLDSNKFRPQKKIKENMRKLVNYAGVHLKEIC